MALFFGRTRGPQAGVCGHLADEVRCMLALGEDSTARVYELACGHGACGGVETIIVIMRAGQRSEARKIAKAAHLITAADLKAALA